MTTFCSDPLVPLTYASYAQMMLRGSTVGELPLSYGYELVILVRK